MMRACGTVVVLQPKRISVQARERERRSFLLFVEPSLPTVVGVRRRVHHLLAYALDVRARVVRAALRVLELPVDQPLVEHLHRGPASRHPREPHDLLPREERFQLVRSIEFHREDELLDRSNAPRHRRRRGSHSDPRGRELGGLHDARGALLNRAERVQRRPALAQQILRHRSPPRQLHRPRLHLVAVAERHHPGHLHDRADHEREPPLLLAPANRPSRGLPTHRLDASGFLHPLGGD
mmetsp:Transcript_11847/g.42683  ORF Transcript_11847/g.42683 Transcript_11847/m.42683 type:complete len:238 (+) Transcript_11847:71-784(+)